VSQIKMKVLSSLEKVFLNCEPQEKVFKLEGFRNEILSFQIAYSMDDPTITRMYINVEIDSPIKEALHVRQVEHVPVRYTAPLDSDSNYLRKEPGLYPDLLREMGKHALRVRSGQWDSLWIDVDASLIVEAGTYPVTVCMIAEDGSSAEITHSVSVLDAFLPEQKLIHTKWLHCDCLAQYYHLEVFSEEHWRMIENFIQKAVSGGINMILTPIHTPPLDTRIGKERLTTQLVDVYIENGKYSFGMDKLRRWISMCKKCGVRYFEMAHLFTQWGACHAPKIMAVVNGQVQKIFGWETDAAGCDYRDFLNAYIPAVRAVLSEEGVEERTFWHISDEPSSDQLDHYRAAQNQVKPLLEGCVIMDALSSFEFYKQGVVEHPVVANNHIEKFIEESVPNLWTYYCCGQYKDVSNMFIAMPSARNRILGAQLFKYDIQGFLQWGFNFYNSQYSDYPVNPYLITDGDGFVPAGDTFQVYPGEDGQPEESIRMAVTREMMQDLRAYELLGQLEGRQFVIDMMDEGLHEPITFRQYPHHDDYLLTLRSKINEAVMKALGKTVKK